MKVTNTTSALRRASRERFAGADLRPRVNSKPRGYLRAQQRRVVAAAVGLRYY